MYNECPADSSSKHAPRISQNFGGSEEISRLRTVFFLIPVADNRQHARRNHGLTYSQQARATRCTMTDSQPRACESLPASLVYHEGIASPCSDSDAIEKLEKVPFPNKLNYKMRLMCLIWHRIIGRMARKLTNEGHPPSLSHGTIYAMAI